ncbi:hypothetical protein [Nocardia sp. AG03]|uniref:DUF7373 family lipoprotein n=1 Tax=Nocardia sp. AG03 TaxID=3025312 RepID=UPI0024186A8B|nr:hypothetical protein [Nocardia sp. AG03]
MQSGPSRPRTTRTRRFRVPLAAALTVACLLATACGSGDEVAAPASPEIDLSALNVGNYPREPEVLGTVRNEDEARYAEAMRLAEVVPLPSDIDPDLKFTRNRDTTRTFIRAEDVIVEEVMNIHPDDFNASTAGFIGGFYSNAESNRHKSLSYKLENFVLLFSDEESARHAAIALGEANRRYYADEYQSVDIPGVSDEIAYWNPEWSMINAWFAHKNFVILTSVSDYLANEIKTPDLPSLISRTEGSYSKVASAVDKFTPTPRDNWMTLQRDVDGMIGRTVSGTYGMNAEDIVPAVYTGRSVLHGSRDAERDGPSVDEFGVDRASFNGGALYRARDSESAQTLADKLAKLGKLFKPLDPPKGLPFAQCFEARGKYHSGARFRCIVAADRYAAEIPADQLEDAYQRISSQYSMLINSK